MTGGQTMLSLGGKGSHDDLNNDLSAYKPRMVNIESGQLKIIRASDEELSSHDARLASINEMSDGKCVWLNEREQIEQ